MSRNKRRPSVAEIICAGKVRHGTRQAAERIRRQQLSFADHNGRDRTPLAVYRCAVCGGFHVGSADPNRTGAAREPYKRDRTIPDEE